MSIVEAVGNRARALLSARNLSERRLVVVVAIATLLVALSHLAFLTKYLIVFIDEPWYANAAWTWLQSVPKASKSVPSPLANSEK